MEDTSVYEVLSRVQQEISVPKNQYNQFGKYKFRSLEDINAAAKPICEAEGAGYYFEDEIVPMHAEEGGNDACRWYLKSTVTFFAKGCSSFVKSTAYAREPKDKKGMDEAQVTGLASSYARKYAICGLFRIDSGDDPDKMDNRGEGSKTRPQNGSQGFKREQDLESVMFNLACQLAVDKEKTADEVMEAVEDTDSMKRAGVVKGQIGYTDEQYEVAIGILRSWIAQTRGETR